MKARFNKFLVKNKKIINLGVGEVKIVKSIGEGGNGVVYSGEVSGHTFAFKFLLTDKKGESQQLKLKRFIAEYFNIQLLKDNKGIVKLIDFDILEINDEQGVFKVPVIIMKRYDCSLKRIRKSEAKTEFERVFNFLLDTIQKIHSEGIIHRDIKPENILVNDGELALADFGIASYNPEIFKIRAKTKKTERLANRLFSPPEQEKNAVVAHETMDIYALGQVLHWLVFGETHRGTKRKRISSIYPELSEYDSIIDKCLGNSPIDRFQSIKEIRDYLDNNEEKQVDIWYYLYEFGDILMKSFPKNEFGIVHSDNKKRIDKLFQSFKNNEDKFQDRLWWHTGSGNIFFKLEQKGEGVWKFGGRELNIHEIWIHYDLDYYNDFIVVHYEKGEPFIINGKEQYYTIIVDEKHHITYSEYDNKFAEINDEVIDLKEHKVEFIERFDEEGYLIVATNFHCILRYQNDETVRNFIEMLKVKNGKIDIEDFQEFERKIRKHKLPQIEMDL